MSARAIRALRGDHGLLPTVSPAPAGEEDEDEDDDENDGRVSRRNPPNARNKKKPSAFAAMLEMDSSDEDEEESSTSSTASSKHDPPPDDESTLTMIKNAPSETSNAVVVDEPHDRVDTPSAVASQAVSAVAKEEEKEEEEEDFDAILSEFQLKDSEGKQTTSEDTTTTTIDQFSSSDHFSILLDGLDSRDLDMEFTMRTSLLGGSSNSSSRVNESSSSSTAAKKPRKKRQGLLFGPPRDGWIRPPHYVGGGMGMTSYDKGPRPLPWPYSDSNINSTRDDGSSNPEAPKQLASLWSDPKRWFTFINSDSYQKDCTDFSLVQQSGDLNALVLFVAHHPYVTDALLQLSSVLYQTNHSHEGLSLLRRCLWIYESSALVSFTRDLDGGSGAGTFMDADQPENINFFNALAKLIQVSNIAGLPRTALAVSRYVLSLDPLRDPKGLLLALDHFALATNLTAIDQWLVRLVEGKAMQICYRDSDKRRTYRCELLDLPNWMYSYALALYRLNKEYPSSETEQTANTALRKAINRFPAVVGQLLQENDIDTTGRSFRRDWITVLDFTTDRARKLFNEWSTSVSGIDTVDMAATLQVIELVVKIFIMQNARLWSDDGVLQWLYDNLKTLKDSPLETPEPPSPAVMRYAEANPADYDKKIQQFPPEANIIDQNLVAHAMVVDPNRPRFLRREHRAAAGEVGPDDDVDNVEGFANRHQLLFAGPPTNVINPDWPLVEVFWRSFFPWNRVEGVPPPRR